MDKILLFIPMYNCSKQITRVLNQLTDEVSEYLSEVIIVNNRSTDDGEEVVEKYLNENPPKVPVSLLRNDENYGLGGSHKVAFKYAIDNGFDYVIVLHGDDQGAIADFLPAFKSGEYRNVDCYLGARFMKGSRLVNYSGFRTFGNRVFNMIFSASVGRRIYDLGAGLNMYKVSALVSDFYHTYPDNLTFNCYMLFALKEYKLTHKFVPISWREDDQVSNVKMVSQATRTLKMAMGYLFKGTKFLATDSRENKIDSYTAEKIR